MANATLRYQQEILGYFFNWKSLNLKSKKRHGDAQMTVTEISSKRYCHNYGFLYDIFDKIFTY
ncbi:hypothetical protein QHH11_11685 [Aphanizomenon sp. PH219]|nr:hypothetical protein [Aphanizomenon sp. 202]MDK2459788.1 hypothetical protein [Aphanizomenon sp. PH219]